MSLDLDTAGALRTYTDTIFVATNGDQNVDGRQEENPTTLQHALDIATNGELVRIGAGSYVAASYTAQALNMYISGNGDNVTSASNIANILNIKSGNKVSDLKIGTLNVDNAGIIGTHLIDSNILNSLNISGSNFFNSENNTIYGAVNKSGTNDWYSTNDTHQSGVTINGGSVTLTGCRVAGNIVVNSGTLIATNLNIDGNITVNAGVVLLSNCNTANCTITIGDSVIYNFNDVAGAVYSLSSLAIKYRDFLKSAQSLTDEQANNLIETRLNAVSTGRLEAGSIALSEILIANSAVDFTAPSIDNYGVVVFSQNDNDITVTIPTPADDSKAQSWKFINIGVGSIVFEGNKLKSNHMFDVVYTNSRWVVNAGGGLGGDIETTSLSFFYTDNSQSEETADSSIGGAEYYKLDNGSIYGHPQRVKFTSHGFTVGATLYLGSAGAATETIPTTTGHYIQEVGFVVDANTIDVKIGEVAVVGASSGVETNLEDRVVLISDISGTLENRLCYVTKSNTASMLTKSSPPNPLDQTWVIYDGVGSLTSGQSYNFLRRGHGVLIDIQQDTSSFTQGDLLYFSIDTKQYTKHNSNFQNVICLGHVEAVANSTNLLITFDPKPSSINNSLSRYNLTEFNPVADYNPATKKYVDDGIAAAVSGDSNAGYVDVAGLRIQLGSGTTSNTIVFPAPFADNNYSIDITPLSNSTTQAYSVSVASRFSTYATIRRSMINNNSSTVVNFADGYGFYYIWSAIGKSPV